MAYRHRTHPDYLLGLDALDAIETPRGVVYRDEEGFWRVSRPAVKFLGRMLEEAELAAVYSDWCACFPTVAASEETWRRLCE